MFKPYTMVHLKEATYKTGGQIQGMITGYATIHKNREVETYYVVEIMGPHVAYYVEKMNLTVSQILVHPDSILLLSEHHGKPSETTHA